MNIYFEFKTGAKIIIRGKGSVKEGKIINKDGAPLPGEDEQLHAYITGPTIEVVAKAVEKVYFVLPFGPVVVSSNFKWNLALTLHRNIFRNKNRSR